MKHKLYNSFLIVGLIVVAASLVYISLFRAKDPYGSLFKSCQRASEAQYADCLGRKFYSLANHNPSKLAGFQDYVYAHTRQIHAIDLRVFSDYAHNAGMLLAGRDLTLPRAATICGTAFKGGCLHGYVMETLDQRVIKPERLTAYCNQLSVSEAHLNCIHGAGHEIWAKARTGLEQALTYCDPLPDVQSRQACWSGVMMEYSIGESTGRHNHGKIMTRDLPCDSLARRFKTTCYAAAGSYRQYYPDAETSNQTYKYCDSIPRDYADDCRVGVKIRLDLATGKL